VVVPVLAGAAVFATFLLGRAVRGPGVGLLAAVCLALSPIFLRQSTQVMSDVPAAAWWTLALALACTRSTPAAAASGTSAALAFLTRPNLAPIGVAVLAVLASHRDPARARRIGLWLIPCVAAGLFLAALHTQLYGSALRSGYGAGQELYALGHVWPNLARYGQWLWQSEAVFLLLAVPAAFAGTPARLERATVPLWPLAIVVVLTVASYLPYAVFDDWWYTRFLLPAFPAALVLASAGISGLVQGRPTMVRVLVVGLAIAGVGWQARSALGRLDVLTLAPFDERYALAGQRLVPIAGAPVVLAAQHSGSVHHYAGVPTLRWDLLPAGELDRALTYLRTRGHRPLILLDAPEEPVFRARFAASSDVGRLDWPPAGEVRTPIGVRLYDPADRDAYRAGRRVDTRSVFPTRE
jgi:4-amino-4-deoxy-L-arabinose transferase-like glycosyltransferase